MFTIFNQKKNYNDRLHGLGFSDFASTAAIAKMFQRNGGMTTDFIGLNYSRDNDESFL